MKRLGILFIVVGLFAAFLVSKRIGRTPDDDRFIVDVSADTEAVRGTLKASVYGDEALELKPVAHRTLFVNGPDYSGMEDNDLRGFLDGFYSYDFNQSTQVHVRLGRRFETPWRGELELFRVIHRWDDIKLPPAATITGAQLDLFVEYGPKFPVDVFLYEVKKDWNPGEGGVEHDNVSARSPGEVWWLDMAYQETPWGLPGVGFASDTHAGADTGAMPLASARYRPGDVSMQFSSPELTRYIGERVSAGRSLLFLLKLGDAHEDSPGSNMALYSGNYGDTRNTDRRPSLSIEWNSPAEILRLEKAVFLEYGRSVVLPPLGIDGARFVSFSFEPMQGFEEPTIEVRDSGEGGALDWRRVSVPLAVSGEELDIRLRAGRNLVEIGRAFEASLRDTWVISSSPEEQVVSWRFESPSGREYFVDADYQGDYRWKVRFVPQEIGRWRYSWTQEFIGIPFASTVGQFDVLGGDADVVRQALIELRDRIRQTNLSTVERYWEFEIEFIRLERAAMQTQTLESFNSKSGLEIRALLREIRVELAEEEFPATGP